MRALGDEIAVLEGLGENIPSAYARMDVLDASSGANYSGGSSFAPGLPLLPSNAGLAALDAAFDIEKMANQIPVDFPIPVQAKTLQQYLAAAGAKISTDGVWGSGSNKALIDFVRKRSPGEVANLQQNLSKIVAPFAKGRMVLLTKPKLLFGIFQSMVEKVNAGNALEGIPNAYSQMDVLDASAGANYSGGSSFAPGLPLLPSNAGLAGLADDDLNSYYQSIQKGAYARQGVIDASAGANYSGGSSYAPGLPLTPSNAGLADSYDGRSLDDVDKYWGSTMGVESTAYNVQGVLDASAGANYSGGSSYAPGLPLLPSNAGLAGLDQVSDKVLTMPMAASVRAAFKRQAGQRPLLKTKTDLSKLQRLAAQPMSAEKKAQLRAAIRSCVGKLMQQRQIRAKAAGTARLALTQGRAA